MPNTVPMLKSFLKRHGEIIGKSRRPELLEKVAKYVKDNKDKLNLTNDNNLRNDENVDVGSDEVKDDAAVMQLNETNENISNGGIDVEYEKIVGTEKENCNHVSDYVKNSYEALGKSEQQEKISTELMAVEYLDALSDNLDDDFLDEQDEFLEEDFECE